MPDGLQHPVQEVHVLPGALGIGLYWQALLARPFAMRPSRSTASADTSPASAAIGAHPMPSSPRLPDDLQQPSMKCMFFPVRPVIGLYRQALLERPYALYGLA